MSVHPILPNALLQTKSRTLRGHAIVSIWHHGRLHMINGSLLLNPRKAPWPNLRRFEKR